jgi:hypothetical protein
VPAARRWRSRVDEGRADGTVAWAIIDPFSTHNFGIPPPGG